MKKSNKGFSLVELIIVIAIMAILAGALAPALMKYINKTRLSSDIQAGQTVAKAVQAAMTNEDAFNSMAASWDFVEYTEDNMQDANYGGGEIFSSECASVCAWDKAVHKAKKDMDGSTLTTGNFYVKVDVASNTIVVAIDDEGEYEVYPTPAKALSQKTVE